MPYCRDVCLESAPHRAWLLGGRGGGAGAELVKFDYACPKLHLMGVMLGSKAAAALRHCWEWESTL